MGYAKSLKNMWTHEGPKEKNGHMKVQVKKKMMST
jgi:hypothetical protein